MLTTLNARCYDEAPNHSRRCVPTPRDEQDAAPVLIRDVTPLDAEGLGMFVRQLSRDTRYLRFMSANGMFPRSTLRPAGRAGPQDEITLVAAVSAETVAPPVGVAHYTTDGEDGAEFDMVVADPWAGSGLAHELLGALVDSARRGGIVRLHGDLLAVNVRMIRFLRRFGFEVCRHRDDLTLLHAQLALSEGATH